MKNDLLIQAEAALAKADAEVRKRETEHTEAVAAEHAASVAYDSSESESDQKKAVSARVRRESKERLLDQARKSLDRARTDVAAHERARAEAECAAERSQLRAWTDALSPHISAIVEADRRAHDAVLAIAGVVVDAGDLHDLFQKHALALFAPVDVARPAMTDAMRLAREAVTADRAADDREDISPWLIGINHDWKTAGLNPLALEIHERTSARNRQLEHDMAIANAAAQGARATNKETAQ